MKANNMMPPHTKQIGDYIFYIRPFDAFKAARISGELISIISPILVSVLPALVGNTDSEGEEESSIFDIDIASAMPSILPALSSLNGDKVESLMRTLLVQYRNISFEEVNDKQVAWLGENEMNEVFYGDITGMFVLAFEVLKLNFKGFFKNLGNLSGSQEKLLSQLVNSKSTDTSTVPNSMM